MTSAAPSDPDDEAPEGSDTGLDRILRELAAPEIDETIVAPGQLLGGRYRVGARLGAGGMGVVYVADDVSLARPVALKVVRAPFERFEQEARALSRLRHPNVAQVFDFGADGPHRYLVMELLEGETLEATLRREGALSLPRALETIEPIGRALAFAHAQGIVHRDVKPANVFLAQTPIGVVPKLIDFGIAKLEPGAGTERVTSASEVIGTAAYVAPEQLRDARSAGPRADQYAFATMLYEALAGALPFDAQSGQAMIAAKSSEAPIELRVRRPDLPAPLTAAVHRALSRAPESRFEGIGELLDAMRARPRSPGRIAAVALAVVAVLAGIAWLAWSPAEPVATSPAPIQPAPVAAPAVEPVEAEPARPEIEPEPVPAPALVHRSVPRPPREIPAEPAIEQTTAPVAPRIGPNEAPILPPP